MILKIVCWIHWDWKRKLLFQLLMNSVFISKIKNHSKRILSIQLLQLTISQYSDIADPSPVDNHTHPPNDDDDGTIKQDSLSSCDGSVVLTVQIDTIETPLEWSARMKRYQQEEIQYLGLDIIKPQISPPVVKTLPTVKPTPVVQKVCPYRPPRNDTVLSKQRFEEWLDTLHPRASPGIPVSQPSTVANSTISEYSSENDRNDNWLQSRDDGSRYQFYSPSGCEYLQWMWKEYLE